MQNKTKIKANTKILLLCRLAILKLNGEQLLKAKDDGAFLDILKRYFATLDSTIGDGSGMNSRLTVSFSGFFKQRCQNTGLNEQRLF
jgi:hypothetical protein